MLDKSVSHAAPEGPSGLKLRSRSPKPSRRAACRTTRRGLIEDLFMAWTLSDKVDTGGGCKKRQPRARIFKGK
jgi:hypothetical protein